MYPLKFKKCFIKKVWGGREFEESLDMKLPSDERYGESWEVSSHKNGMSYVENGLFAGKSLQELVNEKGLELLGNDIIDRFNGQLPVLIKYLDVNDRLSVQVHPSDKYALRVEGEFGKSESWYIIEASENAKLIMGIKEGITKETFLTKARKNDFTGLFNEIPVKKRDCININPGLVHASLEGSILICETQQNSDTTYRTYDFDRKIDGISRELHLDKASDVINFNEKPDITTAQSRKVISIVGAKKEEMIRGDYFNLDKLLIDGDFKDEMNSNFKVYSILSGKGDIIHSSKRYEAKKCDTYFIPAGLEVSIQ